MTNQYKNYSPDLVETALADFQQSFPNCCPQEINDLRSREYSRLDKRNQIYLDYTGSGLYAASQIQQHKTLLERGVFGNPHSNNPTSLVSTHLVEQARAYVLEFFQASPDEYVPIFTLNASNALKLVGEAYPFGPGGRFLPVFDNHNSVNGIREYARAKGAEVKYIPTLLPELRLDPKRLSVELDRTQPGSFNLFAYPAQSNFSGVQHSLEWIERAHELGWDVILDAAAYVPTNRLDLSVWKPDFVPLSFYKIFGYPTGVGCLLARKEALIKLQRPWFAGGTISITSVQGEGWHYLLPDEAGFEDGTVNFLNLPSIEIGLRFITDIGIDVIHKRVSSMTHWILNQMTAFQHNNGTRLVHIFGPTNMIDRGGTIAFVLVDPDGNMIDTQKVEALANRENISLRTGCFCNPGSGELVHNLSKEIMAQAFEMPTGMSFNEFSEWVRTEHNRNPNSIRISVGVATNFSDIYRFMTFLQRFVNQPTSEIHKVATESAPIDLKRDSA